MPTSRYFAALVALTALPFAGTALAATTTSPKIVISNMAGQEIPLEAGSPVVIGSNGDLSVKCRLVDGSCLSIGSPEPTPDADAPTANLSTSATQINAGGSVTLTWSSTGETCKAVAPAGITNWTDRALPASGSQLVTIGSTGTVTFSLRCYNEGGHVNASTAEITVEQPIVAPPTGYCAEYYGQVIARPTAPAFTAFGFEKIEKSFESIWGVAPGASAPKQGVPGTHVSPIFGPSGARYLAIPFSLGVASSDTMSQIRMSWVEAQAVGTTTGAVTVTISPCPGDFRAPASGSSDAYLSATCRTTSARVSGNLNAATIGSNLSGCPVPLNKTMYINVATFDMYGSTAPIQSTCPGENHCGVALRHE